MLYLAREEGQGMVEYALMRTLVALVAIVSMLVMGSSIGNVFSGIVATF